MPREKIKFALRMSPETQQLVKEMCPRDNCRTQNEFIEKAIRFYAGYVSGQEAVAYLPLALSSVLRDVGQAVNFNVSYDAQTNSVRIAPNEQYSEDTPATPAVTPTAPPAATQDYMYHHQHH